MLNATWWAQECLKTHVDKIVVGAGMPERWNAHQYPGQEILGGKGADKTTSEMLHATWSALEAAGNPRWKCWEATWSARKCC